MEEDEQARKLLVALVRNAVRNMRRRHHRAAPHDPIEDAGELAGDEPSVDALIERAEEHLRFLGCVVVGRCAALTRSAWRRGRNCRRLPMEVIRTAIRSVPGRVDMPWSCAS